MLTIFFSQILDSHHIWRRLHPRLWSFTIARMLKWQLIGSFLSRTASRRSKSKHSLQSLTEKRTSLLKVSWQENWILIFLAVRITIWFYWCIACVEQIDRNGWSQWCKHFRLVPARARSRRANLSPLTSHFIPSKAAAISYQNWSCRAIFSKINFYLKVILQ